MIPRIVIYKFVIKNVIYNLTSTWEQIFCFRKIFWVLIKFNNILINFWISFCNDILKYVFIFLYYLNTVIFTLIFVRFMANIIFFGFAYHNGVKYANFPIICEYMLV